MLALSVQIEMEGNVMDAVKFIEERNRMCKSFGRRCSDCPADKNICCDPFEWRKELATIVEEWSAAHPCKTRQSVFLEQLPNAKVFVDGVLDFCPQELNSHYPCQSTDIEMRCQSCRREFWMQ